ncbi:MAG: tRNA 4-thiouridine(8) synthase ThiI [Clostridiales bacterium]|nr:tRNA 4-thiouridine(8) synthase ThiI [Clostridiales bacterium]
MLEKVIIVKYGEIGLKGKNRYFFENTLIANIKKKLKDYDIKILKTHGRIYVENVDENIDSIIPLLQEVFGIVALSIGVKAPLDLEIGGQVAIDLMKEVVHDQVKTFKVETRRSNKGFPYKSPEISSEIGGMILENLDNLKVDVHNPEIVVTVEVRDLIYIYVVSIPGIGGMPYKTASKAVLLLSGGIDSPVAGYLMARRGVEIEAVHFHSFPFTSERAQEKVIELARRMAKYTGHIRIHSINILEIQTETNQKCPLPQSTILSRRFMMRLAEKVAKEIGARSLITGESIGQVASQTMESLAVTNATVQMPVFRPLIAMDKIDIIKIAQSIDTFETSILPYEDCCTVFLPEKVVTRPELADIEASEALVDVYALVEKAFATREIIGVKYEGTVWRQEK